MKPSFTPCFFSKTSLYWLRSAMMAVMSTSLKVVSMAAVFCASFRRRAMVWRRRDIRTRSSRAASDGADGALAAGAGAAGMTRGLMSAAGFSSCCDDVALGDAAILAGAGDGSGVDLVLRHHLAHGRRQGLLGLGRRRRRIGLSHGASAGFAATPPAAPSSIDAQKRADIHGAAGRRIDRQRACPTQAPALPPSPCRFRVRPAARRPSPLRRPA